MSNFIQMGSTASQQLYLIRSLAAKSILLETLTGTLKGVFLNAAALVKTNQVVLFLSSYCCFLSEVFKK